MKKIEKAEKAIIVIASIQIIIALICAAMVIIAGINGEFNIPATVLAVFIFASTPLYTKIASIMEEIDVGTIYYEKRKDHYLEDIKSYIEDTDCNIDPEKIYEYLEYHEDSNLSLWDNFECAINYLIDEPREQVPHADIW